MIRAFWRRGVANLRARRWQTALLLLVVTIAATGITAGLDQQRGAGERWDSVFDEGNGAHVVVYSSADLPLEEIAADPAVVQTAGPYASIGATLTSGSVDSALELRGIGLPLPTVTTPLLRGGRWLADGDTDAIVLDRGYALDRGVSIGDRVQVSREAAVQDFEVIGFAVDTVDCLYPQCDPGRGWALPGVVEALAGPDGPGAISMIRLADPRDAARFAGELQQRYPTHASAILDWQDTRDDVLVTNQFFGVFLAAFGAVLLFAGGLVIASTVTARMFAQYREIGLLKAIGFTPRTLTAYTLLEHLAVGVVGVVFGWLLGAALAPSLQLRIAEVLEPGSAGLSVTSLLVTAVIVLGLIAISTIIPAWRAGRVPTSQAIARGWAPRRQKTSRVAVTATKLGMGPVATTGIKDAFARPFRTIFTVATLALSVVAGVIAIGFNATIDATFTEPERIGNPWDVVAFPTELEPNELEGILDATSEVGSWFAQTERRATDRFGSITTRALSGDLASTDFVIGDGRMLSAPEEAVVGHALLERLGVDVGDSTTVTLLGEPFTVNIVGWFATTEDSGEILLLSLDGLRTVEPDAEPSTWLAAGGPDVTEGELRAALDTATDGRATLRLRENFDELDAFKVAFAIITALILAVGLSNLVGSTIQMMQEQARDLAVLKSLGFTPRQILASVAIGAAALAGVSVVVGGLLAIPLYGAMMDGLGVGIGVGPGFGVTPGTVRIMVLSIAVVVVTTLFAAAVARRPARATVADVLRAY